jgi:phenylalanyl-tRNA synthetase alpha chain
MLRELKEIEEKIESFRAKNNREIDSFRVFYLGKKGVLTNLFKKISSVSKEERKEYGFLLNNLKILVKKKITQQRGLVVKDVKVKKTDLTKPVSSKMVGSKHPITLIRNQIIDIFKSLAFEISLGPEIEDDWHNFSALNLPPEHPARDMQDTFFIDKDVLLRTHTSSVQIRYMENFKPPIRTISPGRVYRNEAISSRAHCIFHQIEGLYVDRNVGFSDLKQTLLLFSRKMFGEKTKIRLRPSYFPFTEPSAEVDIYWGLNSESDYRITKGTGWLEIMGCGMVDPAVLENCEIDSNEYSGFAFGMGIERIAMLKYKIDDLRLFYENDIRFLKQFSSS